MKKILSFIPAILLMIMIFGFSAQNGEQSGGLSAAITDMLVNRILHIKASPDEMLLFEFFIRKAAHFSEYLLLSLALTFALRTNGLHGGRLFVVTVLWCSLYACTDEFHQSFVGGRSPQLRDVVIDSCGGLCGSLIMQAVRKSSRHS